MELRFLPKRRSVMIALLSIAAVVAAPRWGRHLQAGAERVAREDMLAQMEVKVSCEAIRRCLVESRAVPTNALELREAIQMLEPSERGLQGWISSTGHLVDPWQTELRIDKTSLTLFVTSAGRDRTFETADDVVCGVEPIR